jgi:hypothetical protein
MRYRDWIESSEEASPYRDAFAAMDRMPFEDKKEIFEPVFRASERAWARSASNPRNGG